MKEEPKDIVKKFQEYSIKLINESIDQGRDVGQSQAGTENESSKDYIGRVVFEFFQNAVDRANENIWLVLNENEFIISNDGKAFSIYTGKNDKGKKSDFYSLNTIHNGDKTPGESVGNKGVSFKSCWNISENVIIETIIENENYWGFELFNPVKESDFDDINIKTAIQNADGIIPSFYFPKYIESKMKDNNNNAVTKITIKLKDNKAYDEVKKELEEFIKAKFFFINQLKGKANKNFKIKIKIDGEKLEPLESKDRCWKNIINLKDLSKSKNDNCFRQSYLELLKSRKQEKYQNIPKKPNIVIAFPPDDVKVESKFYTYLPTTIECGFNVLIHADFALDNARKSIPENDYNKEILKIAAKMLVNELLTNSDFHTYKNFARFLMPINRDNKFARLVWNELIRDNNLTNILKKVYTSERKFYIKSYELIFEVINIWKKDKTDRNYGTHYDNIYKSSLRYFCSREIFIVYIDKENLTFLPPKQDNKDTDLKMNLFYKETGEEFGNNLQLDLLKEISDIKITAFESFKENKDLYLHNKIIKRFSTLEILRVLKNIEKPSVNIYKFLKQLLNNTKDKLHEDIKQQLYNIKLPTSCHQFKEVKYCYINVSDDIKKLFNEYFFEVDKSSLEDDFLVKIGVASNRLPFTQDILPFADTLIFPNNNMIKIFLNDSLEYINDTSIINKLKSLKWWYDEKKNSCYLPSEVFLFKDHDNRKIECIAQEGKKIGLSSLYFNFSIEEIDDTCSSKKIEKQLEKMMNLPNIDEYHKEIYKKLTYRLPKIENHTKDIPLLVIDKEDNKFKYLSNDEKTEVIFLETKHKRYKSSIDKKYIVYFDNTISQAFVKSLGIKIFNPNYQIIYEPYNSEVEDNGTKIQIQKEFLPSFISIANEVLGSKFEKNEIIKRWENLKIYYAKDVQLELNEGQIIESTKGGDIDVLFIPIINRQHHITSVGNIAHDLERPFENNNLIKFARVIADGIFRNLTLTSYFESYISRFLLKDTTNLKNYLLELGIEDDHIFKMNDFINENLLEDGEKQEVLNKLNELRINIKDFSEIRNFEKYKELDLSFDQFKASFDNKYTHIISNIVSDYKNYMSNKIKIDIENKKKKLEILCFIECKKFDILFDDILKKNYNNFKNETDIYKLFEVEDIDKNSDKYVIAKIDYECGTESIKKDKISFKVSKSTLEANSTPKLMDASQSNTDKNKEKEQQEKIEKRGIGQELKLAYEFAKKIKDKKAFINLIKEKIYRNDEGLKGDSNLTKYIKKIDIYQSANNFDYAKNVIQIASHNLDGLGYDLIMPKFNDKNEIYDILKVELKTTIRPDNIEIHLSKNEFTRVLHYMEVSNWQIWLNSEENDITEDVRESVISFSENTKNTPFIFTDYILKFITTKEN